MSRTKAPCIVRNNYITNRFETVYLIQFFPCDIPTSDITDLLRRFKIRVKQTYIFLLRPKRRRCTSCQTIYWFSRNAVAIDEVTVRLSMNEFYHALCLSHRTWQNFNLKFHNGLKPIYKFFHTTNIWKYLWSNQSVQYCSRWFSSIFLLQRVWRALKCQPNIPGKVLRENKVETEKTLRIPQVRALKGIR